MAVGRRALIGRGFLGSVLDQPGRWTDRYNSTNIHTLSGDYDLIVIAAPGAKKWEVNERPEVDQYQIDRLTSALGQVAAKRVVLLSTIDASRDHAYGRHRWGLEAFTGTRFDAAILRLPALYGDGLRKNALFDLLDGRPVANQIFHWYNVKSLWEDIRRARPGLTTRYSAPLSMWEIAEALGLTHLVTEERDPKKDYNEESPFTLSSEEALKDIVAWVTSRQLPGVSPQCASRLNPTSPPGESSATPSA